MEDFVKKIVMIAITIALIALVIFGIYTKVKDNNEVAQADLDKLNTMMEDGSQVGGTTVKQYMRLAARQGTGFIATTSGSLVSVASNGAMDFLDTGAYQTGMLYVVVNVLPTSTALYSQTDDVTSISDKAVFTEVKRYDANGKLNRITYTQVDVGK